MTKDEARDCDHGRMKGKCDVCDLQAELEATNRQVEILSDALAESRREVAAIMQAITDPENQPSQFGTVTMAYMRREVAQLKSLAAPVVQEPVAWGVHDQIALNKAIANHSIPAAPVQEPTVGVCGNPRNACGLPCEPCEGKPDPEWITPPAAPVQEPVAIGWDTKTDTPIMGYTTPPAAQRQWVGLTDDDKLHIEIMGGKSDVMLAETIEAKLKAVNGFHSTEKNQ